MLPCNETEDAHSEGYFNVLTRYSRHLRHREVLKRLHDVPTNLEVGVRFVPSQVFVVGIQHAANVDVVDDEQSRNLIHNDSVALA